MVTTNVVSYGQKRHERNGKGLEDHGQFGTMRPPYKLLIASLLRNCLNTLRVA